MGAVHAENFNDQHFRINLRKEKRGLGDLKICPVMHFLRKAEFKFGKNMSPSVGMSPANSAGSRYCDTQSIKSSVAGIVNNFNLMFFSPS
jgi:hypothetical protein